MVGSVVGSSGPFACPWADGPTAFLDPLPPPYLLVKGCQWLSMLVSMVASKDKQIGRFGYQNLPTIVDGVAIPGPRSE